MKLIDVGYIIFHELPNTDEWLARMEDRLIKRAAENHDNYSAVAIRAEESHES